MDDVRPAALCSAPMKRVLNRSADIVVNFDAQMAGIKGDWR